MKIRIMMLMILLTSQAVAACGNKPPPPNLGATATVIAANILATQTAAAPTATLTPTSTSTPTDTPMPTHTPTHTPSATPTHTPPPTFTPTLEPTDTPTATPIPPTPTPTPPPPTPTPVDETQRLIIERIVQSPLIGGDKWGLIVVNCHETDYLDWYIEEPRNEHRLITKIPAFHDGHCGVSHLEGLYSSVTYDFGFFAPWLGGKKMYRRVNFPAGQIGVLTYGQGGIQLWGSHADLQASLSPP